MPRKCPSYDLIRGVLGVTARFQNAIHEDGRPRRLKIRILDADPLVDEGCRASALRIRE